MKCNIETFLMEEAQQEEPRYDQEHLESLKKAGFDTIIEQQDQDEEVVIPFQLMSSKKTKAIHLFYDSKYTVSGFKGYVPLQISALLALCNDKEYFTKVHIRNNIATSNVLLGEFIAVGETSKDGDYLIARWSVTPLTSYEEINKIAYLKAKKKLVNKIKEDINTKEKDLVNIESLVDQYFNGGYIGYYL